MSDLYAFILINHQSTVLFYANHKEGTSLSIILKIPYKSLKYIERYPDYG